MARHPNFAKLDKAHILEWAAHHTLESFGYKDLHEIFKNKEYLVDGDRKSYYLEVPQPDGAAIRHGNRVANLIAKYLLLTGGQPTFVSSVSELSLDAVARYLPREVDQDPKLAAVLGGAGYLVIPSFCGTHAIPTEELYDKRYLEEIGDRLASHVYDGGGLVLVGLPISCAALQHFGNLAEVIATRFEVHKLHAKDQQ